MLSIAALSGPLPRAGLIVAALLAAGAIVIKDARARAAAVLGALALAPILLTADVWHNSEVTHLRHHPALFAVAVLAGIVAVVAFSVLLHRRPRLLAPLACATLPFRLPIANGGTTANLLLPLYFVIAAAALGWAAPTLWAARGAAGEAESEAAGEAPRGAAGEAESEAAGEAPSDPERAVRRSGVAVLQRERRERIHLFEYALAAYIVLYAVQALYSADFEKALQNAVFFYVPFALLLSGLRELDWDRRLVVQCLLVTVALALAGSLLAYVEELTKHLLWNPRLIASDQQHRYFEVNSFFYDPNIFGRYLSLVMIVVAVVLVYDERVKVQLAALGVEAVLWGALIFTLSRSSLVALVVGLAVIGAYRWRAAPVLALGGALALIGVVAVIVSPATFGINQGLNNASSGRANLVSGGLHLFKQRPLTGHGSGSFTTEYRLDYPNAALAASDSHNIPVTIASEQGLIGLASYALLVIAAIFTLLRGARGDPARVAVAASWLALLLHTMLYADFLEDPTSWVLLGVGGALAIAREGGAVVSTGAGSGAGTGPAADLNGVDKAGDGGKESGGQAPAVHQESSRQLHRA